VGATINWCVSIWLTAAFPVTTGHKILAAAVGIMAGTAFNFVLCRYVVFQAKRPSPDSTEPAVRAGESDAASTDEG
jgi:putative flippase GtrA